MSTISEAAERYAKYIRCQSDARLRDPYDRDEDQKFDDLFRLSNEYLRLTDQAPLTPDVLKRVGFEQIAGARSGNIELGKLQVEFNAYRSVWVVCEGAMFNHIWYPPRTLGELRMLTMRLGITLNETE